VNAINVPPPNTTIKRKKIGKFGKPLAKLTKSRKEQTQINNLTDENWTF
jgi:hypothetical protein